MTNSDSVGRTKRKWALGDYLRLLLFLGLFGMIVWYLPGLALAVAVVVATVIPIVILREHFLRSGSPRIEFWVKVGGFTFWCAILSAIGWVNYGNEYPVLVIGTALLLYAVGIWVLCDEYSLTPPILGKIIGATAVLTVLALVAWYLYPENLLSKPLTSLSINELLGIFGWFFFVGFVLYSIWERLQDD